ncbi:MAG: type II toxin-antitoxin system RelE/ParE family toxin [Alphaproteobacteria bacterium]|nr:type II toxin-antitoxin system RelE/ParE family toxin [Alphaproteobacteria bacterium]
MAQSAPVTVVETPEFLAATRKLMDEDERVQLVDFLASNPETGDLIPGTGGVRKLRWGLEGRGKRGGARVIYFFHSEKLPLFVYSIYAKNTQADLSDSAKNELKKITKWTVESYGKP